MAQGNGLKLILARNGQSASPVVLAAPSSAWNGVAGSGWVSPATEPTDPTRTTAKPVLQPYFSPWARFASNLSLPVLSLGNGGVAKVRLHIECAVFEQPTPAVRTYLDCNGDTQWLYGFWFEIDHAACMALSPSVAPPSNALRVYFEAIPSDPTMQSRVSGPYLYYPESVLYDAEYEVDPTKPASGNRVQTTGAALSKARLDANVQNLRIKLMTPGPHLLTSAGAAVYAKKGHAVFEAADGVDAVIGGTLSTTAAQAVFTTNYNGIKLRGQGITLDWAYFRQFPWLTPPDASVSPQHVLDGIYVTNSRGPAALSFGIPAAGMVGDPYVYHTKIENLITNPMASASTAVNNTANNCGNDMVTNTACVVGNKGTNNNKANVLRTLTPVMTVAYSGASGTIEKYFPVTPGSSGQNDPASTITIVDDGGTHAFGAVGTFLGFGSTFAGTLGYLANWINSLPGWTATVLVAPGDALDYGSASLCIPGTGMTRGGPFPATAVTSTPLTLYGAFELHPDWGQVAIRVAGVVAPAENFAWCFNTFGPGEYETLFLSSDASLYRDFAIVCNSWYVDDKSPGTQTFSSQFSRACSHLIVWHNVLAEQSLNLVQAAGGAFAGDAYTSFYGNVFNHVGLSGVVSTDLMQFDSNHVLDASGTPTATHATSGGTTTTLFGDAINGDFTPAGALLSNLITPRTLCDGAGHVWGGSVPRGSRAAA